MSASIVQCISDVRDTITPIYTISKWAEYPVINTNLDVRHRRHHSLPKRQQIVDRVGRELPHLEALRGELGHELDGLGVVVYHDELAQLVVGLQPGQETALDEKI